MAHSKLPAKKALARLRPETRAWISDLWARMPRDVAKASTAMLYGEEAKYVTWHLPDAPLAYIIQVTDVQFGHVCCRLDRVVEYRDWVLAEPHRYMVWTGDMIDAWTVGSPGTPFDQTANASRQLREFVEIWAPARHRILGYVGGNHEHRLMAAFGDLGAWIAFLLRIPYSSGRQLVDVYFGAHQPFKMCLWHGTGASRTKGSIAQVLYRFMQQGDSQMYLMGHLTQGVILYEWKEARQRGKVTYQKSIGALGTSFLETWGTYAEVKGYSPSDVIMPCIHLEANGRWQVVVR